MVPLWSATTTTFFRCRMNCFFFNSNTESRLGHQFCVTINRKDMQARMYSTSYPLTQLM